MCSNIYNTTEKNRRNCRVCYSPFVVYPYTMYYMRITCNLYNKVINTVVYAVRVFFDTYFIWGGVRAVSVIYRCTACIEYICSTKVVCYSTPTWWHAVCYSFYFFVIVCYCKCVLAHAGKVYTAHVRGRTNNPTGYVITTARCDSRNPYISWGVLYCILSTLHLSVYIQCYEYKHKHQIPN